MTRPYRVRRSCLAVPASSERFMAKARGLPADELFLDPEDAVAPSAKAQARANAVAALAGDWGGKLVAVRVNDATTGWAHRDVIDLVSAASGGAAAGPDVIDAANEVFAPSAADFARASRKMAQAVVARGRAAGLP